tara:strand:+ start:197 stop:469 length:273 start_codon:yes stop_codon:yes gene_type:complete
MNIELENPTMYKNIDITLDQLSTTIVALRDMIKKNQDYIVFFTEKLNSSSSTAEVRCSDRYIKDARQAVKNCKEIIKALQSTELITKHQL